MWVPVAQPRHQSTVVASSLALTTVQLVPLLDSPGSSLNRALLRKMSLDQENILQTDAWTRARDCFVEDLSDDEQATFLSTASLEEIFYSASAAQKLHQDKSKSRALISKLDPLVRAIQQYEKALDVYANASSMIMCPLWGSMRVLIKVRLFSPLAY